MAGLACLGLAWFGLVWFGLVWPAGLRGPVGGRRGGRGGAGGREREQVDGRGPRT